MKTRSSDFDAEWRQGLTPAAAPDALDGYTLVKQNLALDT
jgi:hypothetical protein